MDNLTIPVKQQRILGTHKGDMWVFYPVLIWLAVTLVLFFVYLGTDNVIFVPIFIFSFLCIIPVFLFCYKKSQKFRGENALFISDVVFLVKDGNLYANDTKIPNILYRRKEKCIYLNDTEKVKSNVRGISISAPRSSFIGVVEEPYVDSFREFLNNNGIRLPR